MSAVLDTHCIITYLHTPNSLSAESLQTIRKSLGNKQPVLVSASSLVATGYLLERARLLLESLQRFRNAIKSRTSGLLMQLVDEAAAEVLHGVPRNAVPDMPDRSIAATALYLGLPVVTRDRRLCAAGIPTIW